MEINKGSAVEWLFGMLFNGSHPHDVQFHFLDQAKKMEEKQMKEICFKTLETCDEEFNGSLVEYFESVREKVFKK